MATILITGANRGIGLALTAAFLGRGDTVIAAARDPEAASLRELAARHGDRLSRVPLDVTDARSVDALPGRIGERTVDVLVNNAGIIGPKRQSSLDMDHDGFLETLAVNTVGPLRVTHAVLANLKRSAAGKVVTLSSKMGSSAETEHDRIAYRASKAGVNKVMHGLAHELQPLGIAVVTLHPGWVRTDMGGADADIGVDESVRGIVARVDGLSLANTGRYLNHDGRPLPW